MSILFISAGGGSKYTETLIHSLYESSLPFTHKFICLTFYPLPDPLPTYATYFPLQKDSRLSLSEWNTHITELITSLIETHQAQTIIFEGSFVYSSVLQAMKSYPSHYYIWLKPPTAPSLSPNKREKYFDEVILPYSATDISSFFKNLYSTFNS